MEKFLGSFKIIPEATTGFEEFANARNMSKEARERTRSMTNVTMTMSKGGGDNYEAVTRRGEGMEEKFSFQLNQPFTRPGADGAPSQNTLRLEGDRLVGDHVLGDGTLITTSRYLQGGQMIMETQYKGATLKTVYEPL